MSKTERLLKQFEEDRDASRSDRGNSDKIAARDAAWQALKAHVRELEDQLALALPYVEDAIDSPLFRPGAVKKRAAMIRATIEGSDQ